MISFGNFKTSIKVLLFIERNAQPSTTKNQAMSFMLVQNQTCTNPPPFHVDQKMSKMGLQDCHTLMLLRIGYMGQEHIFPKVILEPLSLKYIVKPF